MLDPVALFEFDPHVDHRTVRASKLVVTLGTRDPGGVQQLIDTHLLNTLPNHRLGGVDMDQVIDYTTARPTISFDQDHFHDYQPPEIELHQVTDAEGRSFLLLHGFEPTLQWERLVNTVDHLLNRFYVAETVIVQGVPSPVPHTREMHVTRYAGQPGMVPVEEKVPAVFKMPASFTSLLALRLAERQRKVTGLVAHVPHYLAHGEAPEAALRMLERLAEHTALDLPAGDLPMLVEAFRAQLDAEVAESAEAQHMISRLEGYYDRFWETSALTESTEVPTADEIGAQVEDFLRGLDTDAPDSPDEGDLHG
ncbi:PAC2 family protein [Enemella sp. A6]|uniref:PAC2 family protein n=1 Tax=Enemella sp. A6 TaxID=3440152 RepID=UPI003EBAEA9B